MYVCQRNAQMYQNIDAHSVSPHTHIIIVIYIYRDFLLRRLIIKCVRYFPEFVSFKAFREISFERIWANLNRFGSPFWHPFREELGPF